METLPCHNAVAGHEIVKKFCTCHDSTAVVPCAKFCSDRCIRIEVRVKRNFHRVWIAMEKPLVKREPDPFPFGFFTFECLFTYDSIDIYETLNNKCGLKFMIKDRKFSCHNGHDLLINFYKLCKDLRESWTIFYGYLTILCSMYVAKYMLSSWFYKVSQIWEFVYVYCLEHWQAV